MGGVWYSLHISDPAKTPYSCSECTEKKRKARNCHNRNGYKHDILVRQEWKTSPVYKTEIKFGDVKFCQCPVSAITSKTWELLKIVNRTTDNDCNITMPYRGASYSDQPEWYFQAVDIVRHARSVNMRMKNG